MPDKNYIGEIDWIWLKSFPECYINQKTCDMMKVRHDASLFFGSVYLKGLDIKQGIVGDDDIRQKKSEPQSG